MNAVISLCIREDYDEVGRVTLPFIRDYATRIGADYILLTTPKLNLGFYHYEKLQIYDLFETYDRILFLDADLIVTPKCPDLFAITPEDRFGAFRVSDFTDLHDHAIEVIQEELGQLGWSRDYFNSGVMVASRPHKEVFNKEHGLSKWARRDSACEFFVDQTYINYNVKRFGIALFDIGYRFNHTTAPRNSEMRFRSHIIHYPGRGHRKGSKIEQIQRDARIVRNKPLLMLFLLFPALVKLTGNSIDHARK